MPLPKDKAWFPAKTHGWGWGIPVRWQGWLVLAGYVVALAAGSPLLRVSALGFVGYSFALSAILVAICSWKGEKPGWRWGDDER